MRGFFIALIFMMSPGSATYAEPYVVEGVAVEATHSCSFVY